MQPTLKLPLFPTPKPVKSTLHMQLTVSKERWTSAGWWQHLPHTALSKPCSCWNKHPALPVPASTAKRCTGLAFLPDSPSPLGEMKQEGTASPSTPPEATAHFTNWNWCTSCRLGLIPHKANRPPQCTKRYCIFNSTAKSSLYTYTTHIFP